MLPNPPTKEARDQGARGMTPDAWPMPLLPGPPPVLTRPARACGPLPVDELPTQDLPRRRSGHGLDDLDLPPLLEGRYPRLDEGHQLLRAHLGPGPQHHESLGDLSHLRRVLRYYRRFRDRRVLRKHLLQLHRRDLVALVLDNLLLAVDDVDIALLVGPHQVAGAEPAIGRDR